MDYGRVGVVKRPGSIRIAREGHGLGNWSRLTDLTMIGLRDAGSNAAFWSSSMIATSKILSMGFEADETTLGYLRCIENHVKIYGRPLAYYSDKHSLFRKTREECVDRRLTDTQRHRALRELQIELICAHS